MYLQGQGAYMEAPGVGVWIKNAVEPEEIGFHR
jgi:hypothetical protein